jgi:hypothetical protein
MRSRSPTEARGRPQIHVERHRRDDVLEWIEPHAVDHIGSSQREGLFDREPREAEASQQTEPLEKRATVRRGLGERLEKDDSLAKVGKYRVPRELRKAPCFRRSSVSRRGSPSSGHR